MYEIHGTPGTFATVQNRSPARFVKKEGKMKKILLMVITLILAGIVVFAQAKQTTKTGQDKNEKSKQQTQQTKQTQQTQQTQQTNTTKSTQPAQQNLKTASTKGTQQNQQVQKTNTTNTTQKTQQTQQTSTTKPTEQTQKPKTTKSSQRTKKTQSTSPTQTTPTNQQTQPIQPTVIPIQPVQSIQSTEQAGQTSTAQPNASGQEIPIQSDETPIGKIYISKDFVHTDTTFKKGNYYVTLFEKEGVPWFKIFNNNKELLFEELAVVKNYQGKAKRTKLRVHKEFLKDYEYFRVMVVKPDKHLMLYFLMKQNEVPKPPAPSDTPTTPPAESPEGKKVEEIEF